MSVRGIGLPAANSSRIASAMGAERDIGASRVLAVIALSCIRVAINYHPRWCRQVTITHGCAEPRRQLLPAWRARFRSEEHTSELQSLMRISYAVFCLKKQIN